MVIEVRKTKCGCCALFVNNRIGYVVNNRKYGTDIVPQFYHRCSAHNSYTRFYRLEKEGVFDPVKTLEAHVFFERLND